MTVGDWDLLGENDFMGRAIVPLAPLADKRASRRWFPLGDEDGDGADGTRGEVELALRWVHDPSLDFFDDDDDAATADFAPNELRVAVVRARGLPPMDTKLLPGAGGGTSDPLVKLRVAGAAGWFGETPVLKATLSPVVWNAAIRSAVHSTVVRYSSS